MRRRKSLEKYLKGLNREFQLPYGPKIKCMSDEQYMYFMRIIALMTEEELAGPLKLSAIRMLDLATQSGVREDHFKSLIFYFEIDHMKDLQKDPLALIEYIKKELNERGLKPLNDLQWSESTK